MIAKEKVLLQMIIDNRLSNKARENITLLIRVGLEDRMDNLLL